MKDNDSPSSGVSAKTVMAEVLEATRGAFSDRDFDSFAACFHFPHDIRTSEGELRITEPDVLRPIFERLIADRAARDVIDLHRRTTEARYVRDDLIVGRFVSREVLGDLTFGSDLEAHICLRREGDGWKIAEQTYVTGSVTIARALHPK